MTVHFKMPALSPTMEKGAIAKWLVKPGDVVKAGDLMVEIETDKATMGVEAVEEGLVVEILVAEGAEDVPVGTPLARIGAEGDALVSAGPPVHVTAVPAAQPVGPMVAPSAAVVPALAPTSAPVVPSFCDVSSKASPLARRLAAALGRDLSTVQGSGVGYRHRAGSKG